MGEEKVGMVNRCGRVVAVSRSPDSGRPIICVVAPYHRDLVFCELRRGDRVPRIGSMVLLSKTRGWWVAGKREES